MTQLPPKAPTMGQKWPTALTYQLTPLPASQQTSWMMDDFVNFSSARRNAHRRSASDPISFVEAQFGSDDANEKNEFVHVDDEEFNSMFISDEFATTNLQSANASDQNSDEEERKQQSTQPKSEPAEMEDCGGFEHDSESGNLRVTVSSESGIIVDPKRVKRILANRQSAQRSRIRKLHYISELERSVTTLQTEVSTLSPRVAFLDHQRLILNVDNSSLKQRIAALAQDKIFKDAHQEELKKEIERLRRVYHHQQNMNKAEHNPTGSPAPPHTGSVNGTDDQ